jgi:hypothetical protein
VATSVAAARVHISAIAVVILAIVMVVAEPAAAAARDNNVVLDPRIAAIVHAAVVPSASAHSYAAGRNEL